MLVKLVVIAVLITIIASLGSALFFMMHDKADSTRMVRALTWRVALSISLFLLLLLAYGTGLIVPHGALLHH